MPAGKKRYDTDEMDKKPADAPRLKDRAKDRAAEDRQRNYGFGQRAELDTDAEKTERQEYVAHCLPATQKYSVDKVGRAHE